MKLTERFTLWGNMYASDGVYVPDKIASGSFEYCLEVKQSDPWPEYHGMWISEDEVDLDED